MTDEGNKVKRAIVGKSKKQFKHLDHTGAFKYDVEKKKHSTSISEGNSETLSFGSMKIEVDLKTKIQIAQWIVANKNTKALVVGHNLHSVYLCMTDPLFQKRYDMASLNVIDGFPVWALAKYTSYKRTDESTIKGLTSEFRSGSNDWLDALIAARPSLRIAVIGATPSSNAEAVHRISERFTSGSLRGWDGYGDLKELVATRFQDLQGFEPDLIVVGLGMPMQEHFLVQHWNELPNRVVALVGGAIDHVSGKQRRAPQWISHIGFEWVWRLAMQPRRLWRRYMVEPLMLAALIVFAKTKRSMAAGKQKSDVYNDRIGL